MGVIEIEVDPLPCKMCGQQLAQSRWWAPQRFCGNWHRMKYRGAQFGAFMLNLLT
ncbi:hypothetical protein OG389_13375 [Streptomyces sp. NBC_00435]|uniref:hypothetical protein n=1 Tax=Streptomyces sp. NBC_00435 TaxID=2903649 RepID=UPI002E21C14E